MIHAKLTFTATIVFSGKVDELPSTQDVLDQMAIGALDIEPIHTTSTIGNHFVIMVKPKGETDEDAPEDIPF